VSLPWYETAVVGERLLLRWTAGQKRRRVVFTVLYFFPAAALMLLLTRGFLPQANASEGVRIGVFACALALPVLCYLTARGPVWTIDRAAGTLTENRTPRGSLEDIEKFSIRRIHHPGASDRERLSYQIVAVRKEDGSSLILGEMDEHDALDVSRDIARFTRIPLSWG